MMLSALLLLAAAPIAAPVQSGATITLVPDCKSAKPDEIMICAPGRSPYRIDPDVMAVIRQREAPPPKPELDANAAAASSSGGCIGGEGAGCKGGVVPLVGIALAAAKAAALAAQGEDWRDAIRTRDDEYQAYLAQKRRRDEDSKPRIFGFGVK